MLAHPPVLRLIKNLSMLFTQRNCYTYLIGWSKHNKFYYGKQTRIGCHPDNFWVSYFTSSRHVKQFRKTHGEPDIIQIRQVFGDNYVKCSEWETRVLTKLNCAKDPKFLNKTNNTLALTYGTTGVAPAFNKDGEYVGLINTKDPDWGISIFGINYFNLNLATTMKERNQQRVKEGTHNFLGENNPSRRRVKNKLHHWLKENRNPALDEFQRNLVKNGQHHWQTENHKKEVGERSKINIKEGNHPFGKISCCPHCGKHGQQASMARWHFDNCRYYERRI